MAVLKQRHIDGERREFQDKWTNTDDVSEKTKPTGIPFVCYEEIFRRGSSREGYEVSNITLTSNQSPNATANQLDIFQFAANPN